MNESWPRQLQLQDVVVFNDLIFNLSDAGLPIDLDLKGAERSTKAKLDRIVSQLALRSASGETVEHLLGSDSEIPKSYRDAIVTWFHSNKSTETLSPLYRVASWRREADGQLSHAFLQPLTLIAMAYGGFVYIAMWLAPKLTSLNDEMDIEAGFGLGVLQGLRNTFLIWGPVAPVCLLLMIVLWSRTRSSKRSGLFVRTREKRAIQNANLAENLSKLISENVTTEQALLQLKICEGRDQAKAELPPLIRAALSPTLKAREQRLALLDAMEIYRESARITTERWGGWLPNVVGAMIGGVIVLVMGLILFVPMYELLTAIARP